ncbi:RapZ C-terminal domain-containing protein [Streptosporangium sp. CA-115845]|uniref:RapZ C-terminal domain-containing protein n=1 Tax=Streptosporangium sp. CA-115845 TaxID=3240071 RepID=UPI003D938B82
MTTTVEVVSFGYDHQEQPEADIVIDARRLFRNPHRDPQMRHRTGLDRTVYDHVMATPGVTALIRHTVASALDLAAATGGPVVVGCGCVGGRHRSVAMARAIAAEVTMLGIGMGVAVKLHHRDVDKPVIQR